MCRGYDYGLMKNLVGSVNASLFRTTKFCAAVLVTAMIWQDASRSYADTGSVRLKITKVGFIVGVGGGSGT